MAQRKCPEKECDQKERKVHTLYTDCIPAKRFATPSEIGQLAVIMVSDMKRFEHDQLMYEEGRLAEIENTERENSLYVKMVS